MNKKIFLIVLIMVFFFVSFVSASNLGTFKENRCVELYQFCDNCTYVNLTSVKSPSSVDIVGEYMTSTGEDYTYNYCSVNETGEYGYTVCGDKDGEVICENMNFDVTMRGVKVSSGESIVSGIVIFILLILVITCITFIFKSQVLWMQFLCGGLAYLFLTILSYVTWITSTTMTESAFIDRFFYWIFIILTIGFFPAVLGSLIFFIWKVLTIRQIQNMIKRGVPEDRAYASLVRRDMKKKW